jgi:hypothetical protein
MSTPIPQPPGVPLLGNIFDVDPSNTWWSLKTLAEKYGEWIPSANTHRNKNHRTADRDP